MTHPTALIGRDEPVLAVEGLTKRYGWKTALTGVGFSVFPGECLLIVGPNGAGKTTLLRILAGLTRPTSGAISWFGQQHSSVPLAVRARLGVVMHRTMLDPDLTVAENLRYYARLYRVADVDTRIREVAELVGVAERLQERVRQLSRGFQQRVALARAVLHKPAVLLLDEPDTGLDRASRARLRTLLSQHRQTGGAVLLTTHAHEFGMEVATRALYLDRGQVVWEATGVEQVREKLAGTVVPLMSV
ncbi:heme ABC exporter ATP-binding protein CcmA [Thermomicrobium sp. 4228-Ro]|uniref:heme ABC exporter ATP-binding protein CcmA n=1 Tax=Thermomicrobium sp. 4228-Ro TaxID=2993937 RepID=UPI00224900F9|nr:heme ABC exporter ATP-binding protein CcmA [Thermomicrobium sp. 4228-Ro]MCX2727511.1 heme ABC exporter ATP-binding protein CcmA [Thermomicrobium sp. 4228-Ro]